MANLISERNPIVATVDPDAYGAGAQSSDAVDMQKYRKIAAILLAGIIASSGTLDMKLQEGANSTGTWSDISGKSITQFTTGDNDKQAVINLDVSELGDGKRYVKAVMTFTTAGGDAGLVIIAADPRFSDATTATSYGDLSTVDEIVA